MALNKHIVIFVVYMTFLLKIAIYLAKKAQIVLLIVKGIEILIKYFDFLNVFLKEKALILSEAIELN